MHRYIDGEVVIASKRGGPETLAVRPRRFDEPRAGRVRVAVPLDRSGDWAARARKLTPAGLDAVFDAEGGAVARRSLGLLGPGGHLVVYGASGSLRGGRRSLLGLVQMALTSPLLSALSLFIRGVGVSGYLSSSFVPARPAWFREDLTHLLELAARGEIAPAMGARLPLRDAPEAHRLLATGTAGKLVLLPGSAA